MILIHPAGEGWTWLPCRGPQRLFATAVPPLPSPAKPGVPSHQLVTFLPKSILEFSSPNSFLGQCLSSRHSVLVTLKPLLHLLLQNHFVTYLSLGIVDFDGFPWKLHKFSDFLSRSTFLQVLVHLFYSVKSSVFESLRCFFYFYGGSSFFDCYPPFLMQFAFSVFAIHWDILKHFGNQASKKIPNGEELGSRVGWVILLFKRVTVESLQTARFLGSCLYRLHSFLNCFLIRVFILTVEFSIRVAHWLVEATDIALQHFDNI